MTSDTHFKCHRRVAQRRSADGHVHKKQFLRRERLPVPSGAVLPVRKEKKKGYGKQVEEAIRAATRSRGEENWTWNEQVFGRDSRESGAEVQAR